MDCSLGISDSVVSCIVNQKEEVIKMGYLVKSPSKSREKANYAVFWKLRWCVLVRASYADPLLNAEYSQHFLHYFEDKEHFQQSSTAKGYLDLSHCTQIRSCYKSLAGFNHIFEITCSNGKVIKFSASSCKSKFHWFDALFKNIYKIPTQGVVRSKVISQPRTCFEASPTLATAGGGTSIQKPRCSSLTSPENNEKLNFNWKAATLDSSRSISRHDSGFSSSTSISQLSEDNPPQLPPPRRRNSQDSLPVLHEDDGDSCFSDDLEFRSRTRMSNQSGDFMKQRTRRPVRRGRSWHEQRLPSALDEYFHCDKCARKDSLDGKTFGHRFSQKKRPTNKDQKGFVPSNDVTLAESTYDVDTGRIYEEIDNEWVEKVRKMITAADAVTNKPEIMKETKDHHWQRSGDNENLAYAVETKDEVAKEIRDNAPSQVYVADVEGCEMEEEYVRMDFDFRRQVEECKENRLFGNAEIMGNAGSDFYEEMENVRVGVEKMGKSPVKESGIKPKDFNEDERNCRYIDGKNGERCSESIKIGKGLCESEKDSIWNATDVCCNLREESLDDNCKTNNEGLRNENAVNQRRHGMLELSGFSEQYDTTL